jgi:hypothetical protein
MSIQGSVNELKQLYAEIKLRSKELRKLREQSKRVEDGIISFLKEKEHLGVKYQDIAIVLDNKTKRTYKKKTEKESDAIRVLEEHGVRSPKRVLSEINNAQKGDEIVQQKIKLEKIEKLKKLNKT